MGEEKGVWVRVAALGESRQPAAAPQVQSAELRTERETGDRGSPRTPWVTPEERGLCNDHLQGEHTDWRVWVKCGDQGKGRGEG